MPAEPQTRIRVIGARATQLSGATRWNEANLAPTPSVCGKPSLARNCSGRSERGQFLRPLTASAHSQRWCKPRTRGKATTFAVREGRSWTGRRAGASFRRERCVRLEPIVARVIVREPGEVLLVQHDDPGEELSPARSISASASVKPRRKTRSSTSSTGRSRRARPARPSLRMP